MGAHVRVVDVVGKGVALDAIVVRPEAGDECAEVAAVGVAGEDGDVRGGVAGVVAAEGEEEEAGAGERGWWRHGYVVLSEHRWSRWDGSFVAH